MKTMVDFFTRKKIESGISLNEIQLQAVRHTEGPLLLLASPGSGKTTTIMMRIGYLIEETGIDPAKIKAVTFSRASANDMKERFKRLFPDLPPVDFSTIHSFAFEVVRDFFRKRGTPYQIIEGNIGFEGKEAFDPNHPPLHKKIILRNMFQSMVGENITEDQMEELLTYISFIKNKMIPKGEWPSVKVNVPKAEQILREYEAFKKSGTNKLLLDYDDMLEVAEQALKQDKELLRKYQDRYDYVLTDESQDTSLVQHAIIEKLVQNHGNLCVVGDDDQSIYSWRGAEPTYLLNFKNVYPKADILFMEQNYRSSRDIVDVANQFIKRNKNRYDKNMFTKNSPYQPIETKRFAEYNDQTTYLVQEIKKVENLSEVAVLYRNNSSSIALINAFDRAGIPFYIKDSDNRFFSHWVVEDVLNFMRMSYTDRRPGILEKIHLKFNGYISKKQMAQVMGINNNESVFDNLLNYVQLQDYQVKQLKESKETFRKMRGKEPQDAIRIIRKRLGYEKALQKMCDRLGFRKEYVFGILNTLEEIAVGLKTMEEFAGRLKHLESVLKTSKFKKGQNAVTLSTFHSAKGLEFERVYMIDLIDGVIPSADDCLSADDNALEEAARLFYVGMTRAKRHLELLHYKKKDGERVKPSPFVSHVQRIMNPKADSNDRNRKVVKAGSTFIPYNPNALKDPGQLAAGKIIQHRVFGHGEIIRLDEEFIEIHFQKEVKKLAIKTCIEMGLLELSESREKDELDRTD